MENIEQLIELLIKAKDAYYNSAEPIMTDAEFDALEEKLRSIDPNNQYFFKVGSELKGDKVKLPNILGSLDQLQLGQTKPWLKKNNLLEESFVITSKLDGLSIMLVYNPTLVAAYTRGDGIFGKDITRHIKRMQHIPQKVSITDRIFKVRGEIIIKDSDFEKINVNGEYKNARNYVAGQVNRITCDDFFIKYAQIITYEVLN